jgi:GNAT acetyltransferase-like protein
MRIDVVTASALYDRLPTSLRLATLSPNYVEIDASRSPDVQATYWCYQEAESFWYHGFHLAALPGVDGFDIQSPYPYGGPLSNSLEVGFLARAWRTYSNWAQKTGIAAEFIRFHPLAENTRFYGGQVAEDRQTVWVNLETEDLTASYETRVRTAIRKAQKSGAKFNWISQKEIADRFPRFYRDGMSAISALPFYFFADAYFEQIARWPSVRLGICSLEHEWLSAGLFLYGGGGCVEYHLGASSDLGKRLSANNLLLHEVALSAKAEGKLCLYLGGGTDRRPNNSLYFYKAGFSKCRATFNVGTARHDLARYERLKNRWSNLHATNPDNILFYRQAGR